MGADQVRQRHQGACWGVRLGKGGGGNDDVRLLTAVPRRLHTALRLFLDLRLRCWHTQMSTALDPYVTLWTTISQFYDKFAVWMNGPFYKLVPEEVESDTQDAFRCAGASTALHVPCCTSLRAAPTHTRARMRACRRLFKLTKYFNGSGGGELRAAPLAVAEEGKNKVQHFQEHLSLIAAICNPGLQDRHWVVSWCGVRCCTGMGGGLVRTGPGLCLTHALDLCARCLHTLLGPGRHRGL